MATVKLTENQLKESLGIKLINCDKFVNVFYKYMPLSRAMEVLENMTMAFVYPKLWYDPYETKYLETDYSRLSFNQSKVFCLCVRQDNTNEEASWKIYKKEGEPLLKLKINAIELFNSIKEFAQNKNCTVYLSKVDYSLKKSQIDSLWKQESDFYHTYFDSFDEEKYVKVMSIKRFAYKYENEYRIFIIPKNSSTPLDDIFKNDVLKIPIDPQKIISRITYYPSPKMDNTLLSQMKNQSYIAEYNFLKDALNTQFPFLKGKIYRSTLYSKPKNVERI